MRTTYIPYDVPEGKQIRVIMNTDAKNEADGQFANRACAIERGLMENGSTI